MRQALRDGDVEKAARVHPLLVQAKGDMLHLLWVNLTRPIGMLFKSFICFILSLFMALWVFISAPVVDLILIDDWLFSIYGQKLYACFSYAYWFATVYIGIYYLMFSTFASTLPFFRYLFFFAYDLTCSTLQRHLWFWTWYWRSRLHRSGGRLHGLNPLGCKMGGSDIQTCSKPFKFDVLQ